jgi:hypothetical protein
MVCDVLPLILAGLALLPGPLHPNSFSNSRVAVRGSAVRLDLRCQTASLLEVLDLDADRDGLLAQSELEEGREELAGYVLARYRLRVDGGGEPGAGRLLEGRLTWLRANPPEPGVLAANQWIDLLFEYEAEALVGDLEIEVTLFRETSPDHRDLCRLQWNDEPPVETLLWMSQSRAFYRPDEPPRPRPLWSWVSMGVDHILGGWDHLAFVIALIMAARGLGGLLGVVTAFTVAHSVTLALAALELVRLPARPVELLIALSIAWVGTANLVSRAPRSRWPEAFAFGLVHGLGFAGFLGEALYGEPRRLVPLLGFNLGVELGQIVVVLGVVAALALLGRVAGRRDERRPAERWLAPQPVRVSASAAVALAGAWWLAERSGLV